jgi:hypothetical protein
MLPGPPATGRDWHHLLELCGLVEARVIDLDGVYVSDDMRKWTHSDRRNWTLWRGGIG